MPGGDERVVGPQHDSLIARGACESNALVDEPRAEPEPPTVGVNEQDPQLRGRLVPRNAEDTADAFAVELGDPGRLTRTVVVFGVVGDDPGDQRFEAAVPAELLRVHLAVRHDHPPEIARLSQRANRRCSGSHRYA